MPNTLTLTGNHARSPRSAGVALELVGDSKAIVRVHDLLKRASASEAGVLLVAEHGVGVESVAKALHQRGRHATGPFVAVDCARAASRIDALLFGTPTAHAPVDLEALAADGRLAAARGGTLFLQDVGELPASVQTKLARVVRDGEASVDGAPVAMSFRLVASATLEIDGDARTRRFRGDLYRRLSSCRIELPPLRERLEDVPALTTRIVEGLCAARNLSPRSLTHAALALLSALSWPGNLVELEDVVERVVTEVPHDAIQIEHLLPALHLGRALAPFVPAGNLREARLRFERDYIEAVLQHHGWRMSEAAHALGIQRPNLYRKARQLGITLARNSE